MFDDFVIALNPEEGSTLPYLLRIPLGVNGVVLKARDTWPRTSKVYCHRAVRWPEDAVIVERVPVRSCERRGASIDLVLGRMKYVVADLAALHRAAVVIEDRYSQVFKLEHVRPAIVADVQAQWPNVAIVFCETRPLAEEWTYRFLAAARIAYAENEASLPTNRRLLESPASRCDRAQSRSGGQAWPFIMRFQYIAGSP